MDELHKIRIKKVLGPTQTGHAVLLGNDEKTFVMYIGYFEGAALVRELSGEEPARPFTHELLAYILEGFNIEVRQVIISDIIESTFCATLVLAQKVVGPDDEWVGKRNEVRIDARPSDCLIIAQKAKVDLYCTTRVLEQVQDVSHMTSELALGEGGLAGSADDEEADAEDEDEGDEEPTSDILSDLDEPLESGDDD